MPEPTFLHVVLAFRDRDLERVERCLGSLARQTFRDFKLTFVDYGSRLKLAEHVGELVRRFDFCEHVYCDSRGWPWNRSHALNVGIRRSSARYVLTTDVDVVFPEDFLAILAEEARPDRVLHCFPHYLPEGFDRWSELSSWLGRLRPGDRQIRGVCQCATTEVLERIRGFDERFYHWGGEDFDLADRLRACGVEEHWLDERTYLFHQWHPTVDWHTPGLMPPGLWGRLEAYRLSRQGEVVRNAEGWGEIVETAQRPVFGFLDPGRGQLRERPELVVFDRSPTSNKETGNLVKTFWDLPSGHALAIDHAFFPRRGRGLDQLLRLANRGLRAFGAPSRLDYGANVLHDFLDGFIAEHRSLIADYHLGFPARDGVSVLVRA